MAATVNPAPSEPAPPWQTIAPHLDDAVAALPGRDRDAVLLRFFQGKSLRDVAGALGVSEDAAKKRVGRAVERLRQLLAHRGVTVTTAAALAAVVSTASATAAPPALVTAATGLAFVAAAPTFAAANVSTIAKGVILMSQAKAATTMIAAVVAALLLAGGGTFAILRLRAPTAPPPPQAVSRAAPVLPVAATANAPQAFDAIYALKDDEVLKLVPPPFPAERIDRLIKPVHGGKPPPGDMSRYGTGVFHCSPIGQLRRWSFTGAPGNVGSAIRDCLELAHYQVEAPAPMLRQPLVGDWVVRKPANFDERQRALEQILLALPKPIRLEKHRVPRPVVVARGTYQYRPHPDLPDERVIYVGYGDLARPAVRLLGQGGGSGNLTSLLETVAGMLGQYVIDETNDGARRLAWRNEGGPATGDRDDDRASLLQNVARQTSLTFTTETREVDIWFAAENP